MSVSTKIPYFVEVKTVSSEKDLVESRGSQYVRLPVTDHHPPEIKDIEQFLKYVENIPSQAFLLFHCRAGHGRTTTFMVLWDIIKNPQLTLKEIMQRQTEIGGVDLLEAPNQKRNWSARPARERKKLIEHFYEYIHAEDGYKKLSWTKWMEKHYAADTPQDFTCHTD